MACKVQVMFEVVRRVICLPSMGTFSIFLPLYLRVKHYKLNIYCPMRSLKDQLLTIITYPDANAQNPGSLEDQFAYILSVIDDDWVYLFERWKISKGVQSTDKMTSVYPGMVELAGVLTDFYETYLHDH